MCTAGIWLALCSLVLLLCLLGGWGWGPGSWWYGQGAWSQLWRKLGSPVAVSCAGGKGLKLELCEGLGALAVVCEAAGIWLKPEIRKVCNVNWLWHMWWIVIGYFHASGSCF